MSDGVGIDALYDEKWTLEAIVRRLLDGWRPEVAEKEWVRADLRVQMTKDEVYVLSSL